MRWTRNPGLDCFERGTTSVAEELGVVASALAPAVVGCWIIMGGSILEYNTLLVESGPV